MNTEAYDELSRRITALEVALAATTDSYKIVQREYAEALSSINSLVKISCVAAESARDAAAYSGPR